jgi:S1-C subfamily serine protease
MHRLIKPLLVGMLFFLPASTTEADDRMPSPVVIDGTEEVLFGDQQKNSRKSAVKVHGLQGGHGSGTYIQLNNHALIITARHVVDRSEIFYVSSASGERVVGQVVWKSQTKDIAILKIPRLTTRDPISLQRTGDLAVGDSLVYTGFPASYDMFTTRATVSGHSSEYGATLLQGFVWFGYSGSGAFDESGRLRAIVVAIAAEQWRGTPQLLETIVYTYEISRKDVTEIKAALTD